MGDLFRSIDWGETCALAMAVWGFFKGGKWAKAKAAERKSVGARCRYRFGAGAAAPRCALLAGHVGDHRP